MQTRIGKRLERTIELRYYSLAHRYEVETTRPFGRRVMHRIYTPTPSSLKRVKRICHRFNGIRNTTEDMITFSWVRA